MSYNPTDNAYIYVNAPAGPDTNFSTRLSYIEFLKEIFSLAGWAIQDVGYRMKITTRRDDPLVPTHTFCVLYPAGGDVLFNVGFSDTGSTPNFIIDSDTSCFPPQSPGDEGIEINGYSENWTSLQGNPPSTSGWKAHVSNALYPNTPETHRRIWTVGVRALIDRGDILEDEIYYLGTVPDPTPGSSEITTTLEVHSDSVLGYHLTYGGFLSTDPSHFLGKGFIATSPSNGYADNFSQIYVYTNLLESRINIAVAFDDTDFRDPGDYLHPYTMVEELAGTSISVITWLVNNQTLHGFVGPYFYVLENVSPRYSVCGCLNIKELEAGSSGEITRARIFEGIENAGVQWVELRLNGTSTVRAGRSISDPNRFYSYNHINFHSPSNSFRIEWPGNVAHVFESWTGFSPFTQANNPLLGTIPGTIVPGRNLASGHTTVEQYKSDIPFVFDEHLWRYWEGTFAPIAFWIKEPRPYDYDGFENKIPMYLVSTATLSPSSFSPSGTCTLTITIDLIDQPYTNLGGYVLVYTDNERISLFNPAYLYYVYFEPDETTATIDLIENGLGITETVTIKIFHNAGQSIYNLSVEAI